MNLNEYDKLGKGVEEFGANIGLNTRGLFRKEYESTLELWAISVSQKTRLDNTDILFDYADQFKPNFDPKLYSPIQLGTKEEIAMLRKKAEAKDADIFIKSVPAYRGFIQPSPEILAKPKHILVEVALHEAFHATPKDAYGQKVEHLPGWEEPNALVAGYLSALAYFKGTPNEQLAIEHWNDRLSLAKKIIALTQELDRVQGFRADEEGRIVPREQILIDKEAVLERARKEIGNSRGFPINNAFFMYWNHFYALLPSAYERLGETRDIKEVIAKLKCLDSEDPFA